MRVRCSCDVGGLRAVGSPLASMRTQSAPSRRLPPTTRSGAGRALWRKPHNFLPSWAHVYSTSGPLSFLASRCRRSSWFWPRFLFLLPDRRWRAGRSACGVELALVVWTGAGWVSVRLAAVVAMSSLREVARGVAAEASVAGEVASATAFAGWEAVDLALAVGAALGSAVGGSVEASMGVVARVPTGPLVATVAPAVVPASAGGSSVVGWSSCCSTAL